MFKEEVSLNNAVKFGKFEFIKFARANGFTVMCYDLLMDLIDCAAEKGDLETIKWAIDQSNGVMRIQNMIIAAATHCHMHILVNRKTWWSLSFGSFRNRSSINPRSRRCIEVGSSERIQMGCQKTL